MKLGTGVVIALATWVIPPVALSAWLLLTPNVLLAEADAGEVVAVRSEHRWFPSEDTTVLQTTAGTFTVTGIQSAPRGQQLVIRDSTRDCEQVCAEQGTDTCADFSGNYMGVLWTVPHGPVVLSHAARQTLWAAAELWTLIVGLLFALLVLFCLIETSDDCERCDAAEGTT